MKKSNWQGKHGPLLIAEIGGNHEGNFEYAKELTRLALKADVDYIKYQIYTGDTLVSKLENPVRNKHFKKFELSNDQYLELAKMCEENGAKFMASVWNPDSFSWIDPYMDIYKIGSGDLTAYPVLKQIVKLQKPIILSTGVSTLSDVLGAVEYIQSLDDRYKSPEYLSILQCTSMYPIDFEHANLNVIEVYKQLTGLAVGYSDHTIGMKALEIAVVKGAQILEFHFTDTREGKEFRDHKVSLTADEVIELTQRIKDIQNLEGSAIKAPLPVEGEHATTFRRSVYPATDLKAGTLIEEKHLICLRPNTGIDARNFDQLVGKKLLVDVKEHQKLEWEYFSEGEFPSKT